jgi:hypothetical protein
VAVRPYKGVSTAGKEPLFLSVGCRNNLRSVLKHLEHARRLAVVVEAPLAVVEHYLNDLRRSVYKVHRRDDVFNYREYGSVDRYHLSQLIVINLTR